MTTTLKEFFLGVMLGEGNNPKIHLEVEETSTHTNCWQGGQQLFFNLGPKLLVKVQHHWDHRKDSPSGGSDTNIVRAWVSMLDHPSGKQPTAEWTLDFRVDPLSDEETWDDFQQFLQALLEAYDMPGDLEQHLLNQGVLFKATCGAPYSFRFKEIRALEKGWGVFQAARQKGAWATRSGDAITFADGVGNAFSLPLPTFPEGVDKETAWRSGYSYLFKYEGLEEGQPYPLQMKEGGPGWFYLEIEGAENPHPKAIKACTVSWKGSK